MNWGCFFDIGFIVVVLTLMTLAYIFFTECSIM